MTQGQNTILPPDRRCEMNQRRGAWFRRKGRVWLPCPEAGRFNCTDGGNWHRAKKADARPKSRAPFGSTHEGASALANADRTVRRGIGVSTGGATSIGNEQLELSCAHSSGWPCLTLRTVGSVLQVNGASPQKLLRAHKLLRQNQAPRPCGRGAEASVQTTSAGSKLPVSRNLPQCRTAGHRGKPCGKGLVDTHPLTLPNC